MSSSSLRLSNADLLTPSFDCKAVDQNLSTFQDQARLLSSTLVSQKINLYYTVNRMLIIRFAEFDEFFAFKIRGICACMENSLSILPHRSAPSVYIYTAFSPQCIYNPARSQLKMCARIRLSFSLPLYNIRECTFSFSSCSAGENIYRESITMNEK